MTEPAQKHPITEAHYRGLLAYYDRHVPCLSRELRYAAWDCRENQEERALDACIVDPQKLYERVEGIIGREDATRLFWRRETARADDGFPEDVAARLGDVSTRHPPSMAEFLAEFGHLPELSNDDAWWDAEIASLCKGLGTTRRTGPQQPA